MDPNKAFGSVLRALRKERSMTQEALAAAADLNHKFVSLLELNQRSPSLSTLYKLAHALNLSGSELLAHLDARLNRATVRRKR